MLKEKLKNKGITLIALIITIVVMLILTGVTLSITLGDNGLVNKAKTASEEMQREMDRELLLSAVVGAIDENGNFNIENLNLPAGFTGSNGTYTSGNGFTFTVNENGEIRDGLNELPAEKFTLEGTYYFEDTSVQINDNKMIDNESGEEVAEITAIDEENKNITIMFQTEVRDEHNNLIGYEPEYWVLNYNTIIENNKVTNILLYIMVDENEKYIVGWQNLNGFTTGELEGVYTTATGVLNYRRLTLEPSTFSAKIENTYDGGNTWSPHGSVETYFYYEGVYYIGGVPVKYDSQAGTIEDLNDTYTKVK